VWQVLQGIFHEFTCFFYLSSLFHGYWHTDIFSVTCNIRLFLHCSSLQMKSLRPLWTVVVCQLTWHITEHLAIQEHHSDNPQSGKVNLYLCFIECHVHVRRSWTGICSHIPNLRTTQRWDITSIPWLLYDYRQSPSTHWIVDWLDFRAELDVVEMRLIFDYWEWISLCSYLSSCRLITILTQLSWLRIIHPFGNDICSLRSIRSSTTTTKCWGFW